MLQKNIIMMWDTERAILNLSSLFLCNDDATTWAAPGRGQKGGGGGCHSVP